MLTSSCEFLELAAATTTSRTWRTTWSHDSEIRALGISRQGILRRDALGSLRRLGKLGKIYDSVQKQPVMVFKSRCWRAVRSESQPDSQNGGALIFPHQIHACLYSWTVKPTLGHFYTSVSLNLAHWSHDNSKILCYDLRLSLILLSSSHKTQSFIFTLADVYLCDWSWRGKWRRERASIVDTYPPACGMRMRWAGRNMNGETLHINVETRLRCGSKPIYSMAPNQVIGLW